MKARKKTKPTLRELAEEARAVAALVKLLGVDDRYTEFAIVDALRQRHGVDVLDILGLDLLDLPAFQVAIT